MAEVMVRDGFIRSALGVPRENWSKIVASWTRVSALGFEDDCRALLQMRKEVRELRMWEHFGFSDEITFFSEKLGLTREVVELACEALELHFEKMGLEAAVEIGRRSREDQVRSLAIDSAVTLGARGRNQHTGGDYKNENVMSSQGNRAAYRVAKLKRDYPEIIPRMEAGEFKSVAAAERAAKGEPEPVRKTPVYAYWDDPKDVAERIRDCLGDDFATALAKALQQEETGP